MTSKVLSAGREQAPLCAEIDWAKTIHVCSDVSCPCGGHFHHCTYGDCGSAQHARCPYCLEVVRLGARVSLLPEAIDWNREQMQPHAFLQWKGTDITMTAHCLCGKQFPVEGDFKYQVNCP